MEKRVWYPQLEKHQSASSSSELFGPRKTSLETQGLFLALLKTIGEIFSLGMKTDVPLDLSWWRIRAILQSNSVAWFHGRHIQTYQGDEKWLQCYLLWHRCLPNHQMPNHPCTTWGVSAAPLLRLSNTPNYTWIDQKSGWTWPDDKTKLYSCQSQTAGLLYQIFHNLFCSYKLTGVHGK